MANHNSSTVSVLVPTYRRPDDLRRCLIALQEQELLPAEIVVVFRPDDLASEEVVTAFMASLTLKPVHVHCPGQVAALNAGLAAVTSDIVAITDDDAAPHRGWVLGIAKHFDNDPNLSGLGGRDFMYMAGNLIGGEKPLVGKVQFVGRCVGNHHQGIGGPREVDILKGANMSYRMAHIEGVNFDKRLKGAGAQVCNDMKFALTVKRRGGKLVYDPAVSVDHFPAVRHDDDQRSAPSIAARFNQAHNSTLALLDFLPPLRRVLFVAWAVALGDRADPGLGRALALKMQGERAVWTRMIASLNGRFAGLNSWMRVSQ